MKKKHTPQEMNQEQVRNILKFIDASQDEGVKESVFSRLGHECFYARHLDDWIGQYTGDVQASMSRRHRNTGRGWSSRRMARRSS